MTQGRLPDLEGVFDHYGNGIAITGWVVGELAGQDDAVRVFATLDGNIMSEGAADENRGDGRHRFTLASAIKVRALDIISGRYRVYAGVGETPVELPASKPLLGWMTKVAFSETLLGYVDRDAAKFLLERIVAAHGRALLEERTVILPDKRPNRDAADLTPLLHQVGTLSADRSAILGRDGFIFLYEGNNNLFSQYTGEGNSDAVELAGEGWIGLLRRRAAFFAERNIAWCQTIIPEKTSVNIEFFPEDIRTPTGLFSMVEDGSLRDANGLSHDYVSTYRAFRKNPRRESLYLRTDSHFGLWGACSAFTEIVKNLAPKFPGHAGEFDAALGILEKVPEVWKKDRIVSGDLTVRFFGVRLYDKDFDLDPARLFGAAPDVELVRNYQPSSGTSGTKMIWKNPDAPIKLRVLVFGNSFFERGTATRTLGWWFKYFFSEFHFLWAREVVHDLVDEVKPDAVVCQSIERFLPVIPVT